MLRPYSANFFITLHLSKCQDKEPLDSELITPIISWRDFFREGLVVQVFGIKVGQCHANLSRTIR